MRDLVASPGALILDHAAHPVGAVTAPALEAIAEAGSRPQRPLQLDPRRPPRVRLLVEELSRRVAAEVVADAGERGQLGVGGTRRTRDETAHRQEQARLLGEEEGGRDAGSVHPSLVAEVRHVLEDRHRRARAQLKARKGARLDQRPVLLGGETDGGVSRAQAAREAAEAQPTADIAVGDRTGGAAHAGVVARRAGELQLAERQAEVDRRTAAHQRGGGLQPQAGRERVRHSDPMLAEEDRRRVPSEASRIDVAAEPGAVAVLGQPLGQHARRQVVRRRDVLLAAERVADDEAGRAAPGGRGQVAQLERPRRQLLAPDEDVVHVDVDGRRREDGAGQTERRVPDEVGIEAEVPRHAEPADEGAAAEPTGAGEAVADHPAPEPLALVHREAAEPTREVAVPGPQEGAREEAPGDAQARLPEGVHAAEVPPGDAVVEEGARVGSVVDAGRSRRSEIQRGGGEEGGLGRDVQGERLRVQLVVQRR